MSSTDTASNQVSDQKSDSNKNKTQEQAGSGSDNPQEINGKTVIGK